MIIGSTQQARRLYPIERLAIEKTGIISKRLRLISTPSFGAEEAGKIAEKMGIPLTPVEFQKSASGFWRVRLLESIRGADVFIINTANTGTMNVDIMNLYSLLMAISALPKRERPSKVIASSLHFPYARQDRKAAPREPISAAAMANLINSVHYRLLDGITHTNRMVFVDQKRVVDRMIVINLHSAQTEGFFKIPVDHIDTSTLMINYIKRKAQDLENVAVTGPDAGRLKLATKIANAIFGENLAHGHLINIAKYREDKGAGGDNQPKAVIVGNVQGKEVFIVDDIVDTGGTLEVAINGLMLAGAKTVHAVGCHAVLSGPAVTRLAGNSNLSSLGLIRTMAIPEEKIEGLGPKVTIIDPTSLLTKVIETTFIGKSIAPYQSKT